MYEVSAYFRGHGWTTATGGPLSYGHYIKPGKNIKAGVEGQDFFLGEAALIEYALKEKIFGEIPKTPRQKLRTSHDPDEEEKEEPNAEVSPHRQKRTGKNHITNDYSPEENHTAEKMFDVIYGRVRCLIIESRLPPKL